jgi:uncharacterized protein DUF3617
MKTLWLPLATLLVPITVISAVDQPQLKEGLWSIQTQTVDNPGGKKSGGTRSICRNHEYDERVRALAAKQNCKTSNENVSGSTRTSESECTAGGSTIKTKSVVTMTGDTAAHSETHSTFDPPSFGRTDSTMIMDQKYIGACPAGMEPGDMMDADGKIIHRGKR